jgi:hypothetical protein
MQGTNCRGCRCPTQSKTLCIQHRLLKGAPDDDETPSVSELRQQVEAFLSQPSDEWPLPVHSVTSIKAGAKTIYKEALGAHVRLEPAISLPTCDFRGHTCRQCKCDTYVC